MAVDLATGAVKAEVPTGANPDDAICEPASKTVWVMNARDGTATIVDPAAAKAVATVPIGGVLEGPALDGHSHLFVNIEDKNEIAEVDLASRKVSATSPRAIERVPTQVGARTGAVDPATSRVYLPTARFAAPATPGQRRQAVPGSFEVLVVAAKG
jgi:DNA-binding beta-propeller fold protein YncE